MSVSLYLDCCALQRPFDDRSQMRIATEAEAVLQVLERVQLGSIRLLKSTALILEVENMPLGERRSYCEFLLGQISEMLSMTGEVERLGVQYVDAGIKPLDALHLAYAVAHEIDCFCTCDDRFLKKAKLVETSLTRVTPVLELTQLIEL